MTTFRDHQSTAKKAKTFAIPKTYTRVWVTIAILHLEEEETSEMHQTTISLINYMAPISAFILLILYFIIIPMIRRIHNDTFIVAREKHYEDFGCQVEDLYEKWLEKHRNGNQDLSFIDQSRPSSMMARLHHFEETLLECTRVDERVVYHHHHADEEDFIELSSVSKAYESANHVSEKKRPMLLLLAEKRNVSTESVTTMEETPSRTSEEEEEEEDIDQHFDFTRIRRQDKIDNCYDWKRARSKSQSDLLFGEGIRNGRVPLVTFNHAMINVAHEICTYKQAMPMQTTSVRQNAAHLSKLKKKITEDDERYVIKKQTKKLSPYASPSSSLTSTQPLFTTPYSFDESNIDKKSYFIAPCREEHQHLIETKLDTSKRKSMNSTHISQFDASSCCLHAAAGEMEQISQTLKINEKMYLAKQEEEKKKCSDTSTEIYNNYINNDTNQTQQIDHRFGNVELTNLKPYNANNDTQIDTFKSFSIYCPMHEQQHTSNHTKIHDRNDDNDNIVKFAVLDNESTQVAIKKFIYSLLLLVFSWILTSYAVTVADERSPDPTIHKPLPDIFIDNFNRIPWAAKASEVTIILFTVLFSILIVFHKCRRLIVQRCFVILSLLYLFRAVTVWVTSMPIIGSHLVCTNKNHLTLTDRLQRLAGVFMSQGMELYGSQMCGDYIYSGHTCMLVVLAHFITEYSSKTFWPFHALIWSACAFGAFCILAGHFHYTVDVILAIVIASRLFTYYHVMCTCPELFEPRLHDKFKRIFPLFYFFENKYTCLKTLAHSNTLELPGLIIPPPFDKLNGIKYPKLFDQFVKQSNIQETLKVYFYQLMENCLKQIKHYNDRLRCRRLVCWKRWSTYGRDFDSNGNNHADIYTQ